MVFLEYEAQTDPKDLKVVTAQLANLALLDLLEKRVKLV